MVFPELPVPGTAWAVKRRHRSRGLQRIQLRSILRPRGSVFLHDPGTFTRIFFEQRAYLMSSQNPRPRARDLGIPFDGTTGLLNVITDVEGVCVGNCRISDNLNVNTGVTAILPARE